TLLVVGGGYIGLELGLVYAGLGSRVTLVELLPRLVEDGVNPIIACLYYRDVGFEEEVREAGYDVKLLAGRGRLGKAWALRKLIRKESPDLVYTSLFDADIAGWTATRGIDVPLVSNLANTAYDAARISDPGVDERRLRIVRAVDGYTSRHGTDHFHAVSQAVKDSTVDTLGVDSAKITVVKRGRDAERLGKRSPERSAKARGLLGIPIEAKVVVTVGRQEYQKGHHHLIEAFAAVVESHPSARLLIAGREGHASDRLRRLIAALDLDSVITLLGHRGDIPDVLAASDVFAFPSLYEGLGGALIEALALELPVVVSDLPALREVVREGENAVLVPPADSGALGSAISNLLDDPIKMNAYGRRSREIFDAEFQAEDATDRLVALLATVAAGSLEEAAAARFDNSELARVIDGMHERTGILADDSAWSVEARWRSFKAEFVKATCEGGSIAVKFGDGWSPADARFVACEEERVRALFTVLPSGSVDVPKALGWSGEPPAVALDFVEGERLFHILSDPSHPLWSEGETRLVNLVALCGQAIGAYHAAERAVDDPVAASIARKDLLGAARRAGVRSRTVLGLENRLERARGYRFSPNDFLISGDGGLVMIDPPHVRKYDYIQRDVSAFTFELHRALIGDGPGVPSHTNADLLIALRQAFFTGYAASGPTNMTDEIDRWMVGFYEVSRITGAAYARIRRREWSAPIALLRWAAQMRWRLGRPPAV
ncbi:MAG: glycosyltransferase, partial [Actinomycetota bacterium]